MFCVLGALHVAPGPAFAQSAPPPSGGLTVCCGGTFGYIGGGSGSVSGSVVGPGGGGSSPTVQHTAVDATNPSALAGSVVHGAAIPVSSLRARTVSSHRQPVASTAIAATILALMVLGLGVVHRKLPVGNA